jgi:hypothetical protein
MIPRPKPMLGGIIVVEIKNSKRNKIINTKNIDWNYQGKPNFSVGTGATRTEKILGWGSCFIVPGILILANHRTEVLSNDMFLLALTLFLAFDVGGGVVCNSLNSCKRFYHSPVRSEEGIIGRILKNHFLFSLFHIHPILVWGLFLKESIAWGVLWYILLNISSMVISKVPLYIKRPVSMAIIMLAIMMNQYFIPPVNGFEWLMPLLFIKIVYSHMVMEEPYRPVSIERM